MTIKAETLGLAPVPPFLLSRSTSQIIAILVHINHNLANIYTTALSDKQKVHLKFKNALFGINLESTEALSI